MTALHRYLKMEFQSAIDAVKNNDVEENLSLLDIPKTLEKLNISNYCHWSSVVSLKTEKISVPEIHTRLNQSMPTTATQQTYLPIFNQVLRTSHSRNEMVYLNNPEKTHAQNYFYGNAMQVKESTIQVERANYTDGEILLNLLPEMVSLLTCILFFSKSAKGNFEIEIVISFSSNTKYISIQENL
ncbi:MAG TPA: hypothetical protein VK623_00580 [Flavobacterium sp.]|nr:hypothetical protein [Flavobacterium sp.]